MKYKVGDRVKVVKHNNTKLYDFELGVIGVVTVVQEHTEDTYLVKIPNVVGIYDGGCVAFEDEHLELVSESDAEISPNSAIYNPLDVQQGGDHYKNHGIQPIEYGNANNLNPQKVNIVKYITRHEDKGGVDDLAKVIHYTLLEAYFVYGESGSTELKDKVLKLLGEKN